MLAKASIAFVALGLLVACGAPTSNHQAVLSHSPSASAEPYQPTAGTQGGVPGAMLLKPAHAEAIVSWDGAAGDGGIFIAAASGVSANIALTNRTAQPEIWSYDVVITRTYQDQLRSPTQPLSREQFPDAVWSLTTSGPSVSEVKLAVGVSTRHKVVWDRRDSSGTLVPAGRYYAIVSLSRNGVLATVSLANLDLG